MSSSSMRKRNARLKREFQQLQACPIPNCGATILEAWINKWHINILVPELENTVFHFTVNFPDEYPDKAPKVKNCTYIAHENVFSDYICLDMLTMSEATANTAYRGWTSAYTISTILVQLQSFLFEAVSKVEGSRRSRMIREAKCYECLRCGHHLRPKKGDVCPPVAANCSLSETEVVDVSAEDDGEIFFLDVIDNVIRMVFFEFCDQDTLTRIRFLSSEGETKAIDRALTRQRYKCFYTLKTLDHKNVTIGLGVKKFSMPKVSRKTRRRTNTLQQLHVSFDYISREAYNHGVRNNVWKDRDFDWFVPLYVNSSHGRVSLPLAEKCILELWNSPELETRTYSRVNPELILNTLAKMMNTTVVNIMKTVEDLTAGELQMFDSIKALEGYSSMHHLLLAFCDKYPQIKEIAQERVQRFIEDPQMRDKEITPDLGELLIDVAVSDYSWDDICSVFLEEGFIRNARWILAKHPNLLELEKTSSCVRLTQSLSATRTGKRLAMFQRFFITEVASPLRLKGNPDKNRILLKEYNDRLGLPEEGMAEKLQSHSRKVIACENWWDYFELVDFCPPSAAHLSAWLRNSIEVSACKEYHSQYKVLKYKSDYISLPSEKHQLNGRNCMCAHGSLFQLPEGYKVVPGGPKPVCLEKKQNGIDICFVLDCTGSMGSWIRTAKTEIKNIIATVSKKCERSVRFAIAGYRDHHSKGYGDDSYVVRSFDFTNCPSEAAKNVSGFSAAGGADYPEAMCCAMKAASDMTWNRDSHQIVIVIADAPPHGIVANDDYPDGCPCGEDSFRVAHSMKENGIVIYPVDCARNHHDPIRQTFFHALARITGGYALNLKDAKILPDAVISACMEETLMDRLANSIAPSYEYCLENHPEGRFEQHCHAVFAEAKAREIMVESGLPADNYDETIEHQVESFAFCMSMQQAKAIAQDDYFIPIRRETKLSSYMKRPVTQEQVTKCMKRMKSILAERRVMKEGCLYKSCLRFTREEFGTRWKQYRKEKNFTRKFAPWNRLKPEQKKEYSKIPDKTKIQRKTTFAPSAAIGIGLTKPTTKSAGNVIDESLLGKEIELLRSGTWRKVLVAKIFTGNKVGVIFNGIKITVSNNTKWRKPAGAEKTEAVKKPAAPAWKAPVSSSKQIETPTTASEPRRPTPESVAKPAPVVDNPKYKIGQIVECTMSLDKPTMIGIVKCVTPHVLIKVENCERPMRFTYYRPVVQPLPIAAPTNTTTSTPAMAAVIEKEERKEAPYEAIAASSIIPAPAPAPAAVTSAVPTNVTTSTTPVVHVPPPTQNISDATSDSGRSASRSVEKEQKYAIGQMVECTMSLDEPPMRGIVKCLTPHVLIKVQDCDRPCRFNYFRPVQLKEYVTKVPLNVWPYPRPNKWTQPISQIEAGEIVRILEFDGEYAYALSPSEGWIRCKNDRRHLIVEVGLKIEKVLPTVTIESVPEDCTADDLIKKCHHFGFVPKSVVVQKTDRMAIIVFENYRHADSLCTIGLSHFGERMSVQWLEKYLQYREIAL